MTIEPRKSQDLRWLALWRPRRVHSITSSLDAGRLETLEELMFQFAPQGRKKLIFHLNQSSISCSGRISLFVPFRLSTDEMVGH